MLFDDLTVEMSFLVSSLGVLPCVSFGVLADLDVLFRLNDDNNGFLATGGPLCFGSNERDRFSRPVLDGRRPATCLATVAASALYLRIFDLRDTTTYLRCVLVVVSLLLLLIVGVERLVAAWSTSVTNTLCDDFPFCVGLRGRKINLEYT